MEKFLLFFIAASGLLGISSLAECRYYFVYEQNTWTEAQHYCREKFTDMVTVNSMEDMEILNNMLDSPGPLAGKNKYMSCICSSQPLDQFAWIGLRKTVTEWSWSDFYDDKIGFKNWGPGEPDDKKGKEDCVSVGDDGLWSDVLCASSLKSICYKRVPGSAVKFILNNKEMKFTEAQTFCREQYTDLVSITSWSDNEEIKSLIPTQTMVWIGLFRGSWKLLNGSKSTFMYWSAGQPDGEEEHCAAANFKNSGKWEDLPCDTRMAFICYHDTPASKQVMRVRLGRSSSLDLNDPAVLENLLKKLTQKLKDQGASEDFRLSWRKQPDGKVFQKEEEETKKQTAAEQEEL